MTVAAAIAAPLAGAVVACGGDPASTTEPDDAAARADSAADAAPSADGATNDAADASAKAGSVAVLAPVFGSGATGLVAFVTGGSDGCTETAAGACKLRECPPLDAGASTMTFASAGTVTFTGGKPSFTATVTPDADGRYAPFNQAYPPGPRPFSGGEAAKVTASGGAVGAFTTDLTYPLLLLLDAPAADADTGEISVDRTRDVELAWSRGTADVDLYVQGFSHLPTGKSLSLVCTTPSASGSVTLPSALVGRLDAGSRIDLITAAKRVQDVGDFAVTVLLGGEVLVPSKARAVKLVLR